MPDSNSATPPRDDRRAEGRRRRDQAARDVVATLKQLYDIAEAGVRDHSPAGWNAARAALMEAGRLQMGLSAGGSGVTPPADGDLVDDEDEDDGEPMLDDEAWLARFGPGAPEG